MTSAWNLNKRKSPSVWVVEQWNDRRQEHVPINSFVTRVEAYDSWGEYYREDKVRVKRYKRSVGPSNVGPAN